MTEKSAWRSHDARRTLADRQSMAAMPGRLRRFIPDRIDGESRQFFFEPVRPATRRRLRINGLCRKGMAAKAMNEDHGGFRLLSTIMDFVELDIPSLLEIVTQMLRNFNDRLVNGKAKRGARLLPLYLDHLPTAETQHHLLNPDDSNEERRSDRSALELGR